MLRIDFGLVAIDTNVVIYALDGDVADPKSVVARQILRRAGRFPIRMPLQVASESFNVLMKRFGWTNRAACDVISQLLVDIPHIATTVDSTRAAMELCTNHSVAFWDASIIATAAAGGCGAILSEDFQDRRRFDPPDVARKLMIVNPFVEENVQILKALGALDEGSK